MASFDLRRLDLNLVLALSALLEERNVTAAARRLGVTQSAASQSLARLRRHFGDELLQRHDGRYELSPLAAGLLPQVREVLHGLSAIFAANEHFDPGTDAQDFSLCMSDYAAGVLGPPLASALAEQATYCTLRLLPIPRANEAELAEALRYVDAVVMPRRIVPPGETLRLFHDTWCCVVDATRADEVAGWPTDRFAAQRWVATEINGVVPASEWLRTAGFEARIAMTTPTFTSVPSLVSGTSLLGLAQRRLAERLAEATGTAAVPLPGPDLDLEMVAFHDEARGRHPATRWLLDRLAEAGHRLASESGAGGGSGLRGPAG